MASSSFPRSDEDGFATPAAAGLSLAIAIVASAVMAQTVAELRHARADYDRTRADYALDGAALHAELAILASKPAERLAWPLSTDLGRFQVLAEAEAPKLGLGAAAALGDDVLTRLGVRAPSALQSRLAGIPAGEATAQDILAADPAPAWRACGRSLVSPWGVGTAPHLAPSTQPSPSGESIHIGEVWRIRLIAPDGFTDDRVVRFTGDGTHPAAVVERRLYRTGTREDTCDALAVQAAPN